jgi:DNA-binding NarL/FixJ family response regulator
VNGRAGIAEMRPLRVAIVASSPLVQAGIARAIESQARFELVAVAADLQALRLSLTARPTLQVDVAVVRGHAAEPSSFGDALDANIGLVVLSDAEPAQLAPLAAAGAACLPPEAGEREIAAAIEAVGAGLIALPPVLFNEMLRLHESHATRRPAELVEPLTPRELQVLRLLADGHANKRIGYDLGISEHTAKFHVGRILDKLDAATRAEAVAIGLREGLIAGD